LTSAPYVRTRHELGQFAKARADAEVREDIQRGRAVHTVAGHSVDAEDCRRLLSMLGLEASRPNA
jgi:L-arabinose isomerase